MLTSLRYQEIDGVLVPCALVLSNLTAQEIEDCVALFGQMANEDGRISEIVGEYKRASSGYGSTFFVLRSKEVPCLKE